MLLLVEERQYSFFTWFVMQLSQTDARIMRNDTGMQQLKLKLGPVAALDYQSILLPLVKSYLKVYTE